VNTFLITASLLILSGAASGGPRTAEPGGFEQLTLRIEVEGPSPLPLEPITLRMKLVNETNNVIMARFLLPPEAGNVEVYTRQQDGSFERFRSSDWGMVSYLDVETKTLEPGAARQHKFRLYFAASAERPKRPARYLLPRPGKYEIKAVLQEFGSDGRIESNVLEVNVAEPTGREKEAYEFLQRFTDVGFLTRTPDNPGNPQDPILLKQQEFLEKFGDTRYAAPLTVALSRWYARQGGRTAETGRAYLERTAQSDNLPQAEKALGLLVEQAVKAEDFERARDYVRQLKERFPDGAVRADAEFRLNQATATRPARARDGGWD
jgi:hypothetical protein